MASGATTTDVVVLKVEGAIDRPLLGYLDDRLTSAEADGAVVVLQLDTSGTLDQDGVALGQRLVDMDVPVIAFVGSHDLAHERERRRPAADVRLLPERGRTRFADGAAEPDRPGPPRSGVPGPRPDDPGVDRCPRQGHLARLGRSSPHRAGRPRSGDRDGGGPVGPRAPQRDRRPDGPDGRGARHAAHPHRHHRAGGHRGHGQRPVRQPRADPARGPRGRDAVDDLLPARPRIGLLRLRTHPAGVRVRGVRGRGDAGPGRLRALGRATVVARDGAAARWGWAS